MTDRGWGDPLADLLFNVSLGGEERSRIERVLAADPLAARETGRSEEALAAWAREAAGQLAPRSAIRRRLLETVGGIGRFHPFFDAVRRTFDLGAAAIDELLRRVDGGTGWVEGLAPGVRYFHFAPGPAAGAVECGIVRVAPNATFPRHRHRGPERTIVLDGVAHDGGRRHGPGAVLDWPAGSAHDFTAGPGRDLIVASRHAGIDFEG